MQAVGILETGYKFSATQVSLKIYVLESSWVLITSFPLVC